MKVVRQLRRSVPRILWKYCGTLALPLLTDMRVKLACPNEFNDPFEFTPAMYNSVTVTDLERFYADPEWVAHWQPPTLPPDRDDRRRMLEAGADVMSQTGFEIAQEELDRISSKYAVLCLSSDPDSILMWSHYAQNHRGFVVGIAHRRLGSIPFFPVEYSSRRVSFKATTPLKVNPNVRALDIFRRKSACWAYEKEFRTIWKLSDLICGTIGPNEAFFLPLLPASIVEVRLGYRCPPELEAGIREALTTHNCPALVRRTSLHRRAYRLLYD